MSDLTKEDDNLNIPLTIDEEKKLNDKPNYQEEKNESMIKIIFSGKLPKTFGLIIGNEFCERFCFYGMRAILTLYLKEFIGLSNVSATNVYHTFTLLAYFMPIIGAIISDSWLGKYRTILYLSMVYVVGTVLMALLAVPQIGNRSIIGVAVALLIIAIGTGGIKPCVSSFGADQFQGKDKYLECFFNAFYMSINAGSVLSMIITPLIKGIKCLQPADDPECINQTCDCYVLAFAIPAILMIVAIGFFLIGSKWYIKIPPQGSVLLKFVQAIASSLKNKIKKIKPTREIKHWIDYASNEYDHTMLDDFKQVLSVIVLFAPLCFFWTLYDQTGSTWIIQGTMMSHKLGNWNLTPDLIQAVNPILVLILVPIFDSLLYPLLTKFNFLVKSLHRMIAGMFLVGVAFIIAGFVQIAIINDLKSTNSTGNATLFNFNNPNRIITVVNQLPCALRIYNDENNLLLISAHDTVRMVTNDITEKLVSSSCSNGTLFFSNIQQKLMIIGKDSLGSLILKNVPTQWIQQIRHKIHPRFESLKFFQLLPKFIIPKATPQSSIHILFQLFQYLVLTSGEVLFSISGLHFAYAEAPQSMKSVMTALWLLTNSIGNLITILINTIVGDRSDEIWLFFLYAGLIIVVDGLFIILVKKYTPREQRMKETELYLSEKNTNIKIEEENDSE